MNIVREELEKGTAAIKIQITPEDYAEKVKAQVNKYRKNAKIPGFRKGMVPASLIQKQYGKDFLADELNNILSDSLSKYISENKLELIGQPIPGKEEMKGSFDHPEDFEFNYEIALTPDFETPLTKTTKLTYHKVDVDDKLIDQQIDDLRRRHGKLANHDEVEDKDMVLATLTELDENNAPKENGIVNNTTVSMEFIEKKTAQKALKGKKIGDEIQIKAKDYAKGDQDLASMLGVKVDELSTVGENFSLKINEIKALELAELNDEFFKKLFGNDDVKSEEELRARVKSDLENMFANDSDRLMMRDAYNKFMEDTKMDLPEDFMKRWIKINSEELNDEDLEKAYPNYANGMKWQLIQGKIFKDHKVQLENKEVIDYTKGLIARQYAQYGIPVPEEKDLNASAQQILSDREQSAQIYDQIAETKLIELIKNTAKLSDKKVSYDDFVKLANEGHEHHHDTLLLS